MHAWTLFSDLVILLHACLGVCGVYIAGGIAVAGEDYISISNMVITLGPDQLFVDIPVDIVNDDIVEEMESVYGNLLNITGDADLRVTVNRTMARADIIDGEGKWLLLMSVPLLSIGSRVC